MLKAHLKSSIFFILILFTSCYSHYQAELDFIDKFGNDDFSIFKNTLTYRRGISKDGNLIVMHVKKGCLFFVGINPVELITERPIPKNPNHDSCNIDSTIVLETVRSFLKYNISYLRVDNNGKVGINLDMNDYCDLYRTPHDSLVTKHLRKLKGSWYH